MTEPSLRDHEPLLDQHIWCSKPCWSVFGHEETLDEEWLTARLNSRVTLISTRDTANYAGAGYSAEWRSQKYKQRMWTGKAMASAQNRAGTSVYSTCCSSNTKRERQVEPSTDPQIYNSIYRQQNEAYRTENSRPELISQIYHCRRNRDLQTAETTWPAVKWCFPSLSVPCKSNISGYSQTIKSECQHDGWRHSIFIY